MALVVEDGTGVAGADSYFATVTADAYWAGRTHDALAAQWAAANQPRKDGAAREATSYLDDTWGSLYRGSRMTTAQGLLWPRVTRIDLDPDDFASIADLVAAQAVTDQPIIGSDGLQLAALPVQIVSAAMQLAVRALSGRLAADISSKGWVKRKKIGPLETEYGAPGPNDGSYGSIDRLLIPVLVGMRNASWNWA